jgi:hypothetical protein
MVQGTTLLHSQSEPGSKQGFLKVKDGVWSGVIEFDASPETREVNPRYFPGAKQRFSFSCKPKAIDRAAFAECAGQLWSKCGLNHFSKPDEGDSSKIVWCPPALFESGIMCGWRVNAQTEFIETRLAIP